jgi:hypothetical protein
MIYIAYFFTGVRTADMSAAGTAFVGALRYIVLLFVAAIAQGVTNNFSHGNYTLDWGTIQGWVMPVVTVVVGFIWKYAREATNPAVSISNVPLAQGKQGGV